MELITHKSPLALKNNQRLRNRIVLPPMASGTATEEGYATPKTLSHYQRLTESHVGLLIVEYTYVHPTGRSEKHQLGITSDAHIEGLRKISGIIRHSGALAGIQLTHCGGKSNKHLTGGLLLGPSQIAVPVRDQQLETPEAMTPKDIELWKSSFVSAANRAYQAGFDLIELHAAHGYGLNQWLSPITNQRTDKYGGNLENRALLLVEIAQEIRRILPKILLSVRIPGQDFLEGGSTIQDAQWLACKLEKIGVDIINVSSGIGGWRRPRERIGEGYLTDESTEINKMVKIPVIGVGGIQSTSYINASLKSNRFSLAAVGRAILADPKKWTELKLKK